MKMTKESPGCYHDLIRYLAEIESTEIEKTVELKTLYKFRQHGFRSHDIKVVKDGVEYIYPEKRTQKGGVQVYNAGGFIFPIETKWDKIIGRKMKDAADFKTEVKPAGKYKDSLGGGWHSMVEMVKVNDKYFAFMECSC